MIYLSYPISSKDGETLSIPPIQVRLSDKAQEEGWSLELANYLKTKYIDALSKSDANDRSVWIEAIREIHNGNVLLVQKNDQSKQVVFRSLKSNEHVLSSEPISEKPFSEIPSSLDELIKHRTEIIAYLSQVDQKLLELLKTL